MVEVEEHWKLMRHREMKGYSIEAVPMQLWVGREGKRPELWVVEKGERGGKDESKAWEGSSVGCKDEEGQIEEGWEVGDWQLEGINEGLNRVGMETEWVVG